MIHVLLHDVEELLLFVFASPWRRFFSLLVAGKSDFRTLSLTLANDALLVCSPAGVESFFNNFSLVAASL